MNPDKMKEYNTTPGNCECPAFRFSRGPCKHIKVIRNAISLVLAAGLYVSSDVT